MDRIETPEVNICPLCFSGKSNEIVAERESFPPAPEKTGKTPKFPVVSACPAYINAGFQTGISPEQKSLHGLVSDKPSHKLTDAGRIV
jgi:hypothetical protein